MDQIRVLIADDYEPFRRGVRAMLQSAADIMVVGEAADGQVALAEAEALQPTDRRRGAGAACLVPTVR